MTRDEAQRLVQSFFRATGQMNSPGLNPQGFGGMVVGEAQLYFEYRSDEQALECSALIYKFRDPPKPGVLEGFQQEAKGGQPRAFARLHVPMVPGRPPQAGAHFDDAHNAGSRRRPPRRAGDRERARRFAPVGEHVGRGTGPRLTDACTMATSGEPGPPA